MVNPQYVGVSREELDPKIVETFERYVDKAETALVEGRFGIRYALTDKKLDVLIAEPRLPDLTEALFGNTAVEDLAAQIQFPALRFVSSRMYDIETCATIAQDLAEELQEQDYNADRAMSLIGGGSYQNYVVVQDPKQGSQIQLDATPWFYKAGNVHEIGRICERKKRQRRGHTDLIPMDSVLLSLRSQENGFFTDGYISTRFQAGRIPYYSVSLSNRESGDQDGREYYYTTGVSFHVMNAHRLQEININTRADNLLQNPRQYLNLLTQERVVVVNVFDFRRTYSYQEMAGSGDRFLMRDNSLRAIDRLKEQRPETRPSITSIEADLDVVANILFRLTPVMVTDERNLVCIAP